MATSFYQLMNALKASLTQDTTSVTAVMGVEATAYGDGTLATGSLTLTGTSDGAVTRISGTATGTASATGDGAYADAGTFGTADGADLVLSFTIVSTSPDGDAATSSTKLLVLDLEGFDFPQGTLTLDQYAETTLYAAPLADPYASVAMATAEVSASSDDGTSVTALTSASAYVGASEITGYGEIVIA
jgi:hypothetical protein